VGGVATRLVSADGTGIAVHELGGSGPVLLVAHATGLCGQAYLPFAAELAERHRVVAVDLRGHGDADLPAGDDFAWTGMAEDVLAVVDHLGGGPVAAFGHSMGGAALLLAEKARPGTLARAYLYEPIVWPTGFHHEGGVNPMSAPARKRRASFPSRAEALARYAGRPPLCWLRADALAAYVEHGFADQPDGTVTLKCTPESEARTFEAEEAVTVDTVAGVAVPTVVAVGGAEGRPPALGPGLVAALADASLVHFDHLGHFGPLQDPVSVARSFVLHGPPAAG
jgi:pimeloyl-ACP methyl ester carboxylesterase